MAVVVPDIALLARDAKAELPGAAKAFFAVSEAFRIGDVEDAARSIVPQDYYDGLALSRALDTIGAARRGIAAAALSGRRDAAIRFPPGSRPAASGSPTIRGRLQALTEGGDITLSRLSVASGLMSDLQAG